MTDNEDDDTQAYAGRYSSSAVRTEGECGPIGWLQGNSVKDDDNMIDNCSIGILYTGTIRRKVDVYKRPLNETLTRITHCTDNYR